MNFKLLLKKENRVIVILSTIYLVMGILFCILPNFMMEQLEVLVCSLLLIYGTIVLFAYCVSPVVSTNKKLIFSAIISIVIGLFLLFIRSFFILVLALCVFMFAILKSISLYKLKVNKNINWYIWLIISIIHFMIGVLCIIFFVLNKFLNISMILIGVSLLFEFIGNIVLLTLRTQNPTINQEQTNVKIKDNE